MRLVIACEHARRAVHVAFTLDRREAGTIGAHAGATAPAQGLALASVAYA